VVPDSSEPPAVASAFPVMTGTRNILPTSTKTSDSSVALAREEREGMEAR
jgi:hypothetical protein